MYCRFAQILIAVSWLFSLFAYTLPYPASELTDTLTERKPPVDVHWGDGRENNSSAPSFRKSCGLDIPTIKDWHNGVKGNFTIFVKENSHQYINEKQYQSFPMYLRDKYAPDAVPSSQFCDGIGSCTLSSCLNLDKTKTKHERQMAYYGFEKVSNIEHVYATMARVTDEALEYQKGRINELVAGFTSAPRLQRNVVEREKMDATIHSAITMALLVGSAILGFVPAASAVPKASIAITSQSANLITSMYIGYSGFARNLIDNMSNEVRDNKNLVNDLEKVFAAQWNDLLNNARNQLTKDMMSLMSGDKNNRGQDIVDLLLSDDFIEPQVNLHAPLKVLFEKYFFAVLVNNLWGIDRAYILDTDSQGSCEIDHRGPLENKVCLPEQPTRTYWLYSIDRGQENDMFTDDQATVKGPTGYRQFFQGKNRRYYNLTLQDIVRSSMFVHQNNLEDVIDRSTDFNGLNSYWKHGDPRFGQVPGAFSVPICRNPGGEAISSVWTVRSRNYPCMCGEFGWKNWNSALDQTKKFLDRTGFKYSEDWEDYCVNGNKCKREKGINWNFDRPKGDPNSDKVRKAHVVPHPFNKCKKALKHKKLGHPEKDWNQ